MDFSAGLHALRLEASYGSDRQIYTCVPGLSDKSQAQQSTDVPARPGASVSAVPDSGKHNGRKTTSNLRVGIVIGKYGSSVYGHMLDGAGEWLQLNGYHALVEASNVTCYGEQRAWKSLNDCGCKGIIIHSDLLSDGQLATMLAENPRSVVMNRMVPGYEPRCVHVDNVMGGQIAADYLLKMGHRNVAMITGPGRFAETAVRSRGFLERLNGRGLSVSPELVFQGNFQHECGVAAMEKFLQSDLPFTALFAHNDAMAAGSLEACRAHGIRVPEQLSIIGYDDLEWARQITPTLTTVRQPTMEIGTRSAQILHSLIASGIARQALPHGYGKIIPELIVRDSVRDLAYGKNTSKAVRAVLTTRETECLQLIAEGNTSAMISTSLHISESTVNFHLKNILDKLRANNRTHAVAKALSQSLIYSL